MVDETSHLMRVIMENVSTYHSCASHAYCSGSYTCVTGEPKLSSLSKSLIFFSALRIVSDTQKVSALSELVATVDFARFEGGENALNVGAIRRVLRREETRRLSGIMAS